MEIKPIKTAADHAAALQEIDKLMCAEPGTPEGDRLDVLATLVEAYEAKHFPMEPPNPIEWNKAEVTAKMPSATS